MIVQVLVYLLACVFLFFFNSANFTVFIPLHCNVLLCRIEACTLLEKIKRILFVCIYFIQFLMAESRITQLTSSNDVDVLVCYFALRTRLSAFHTEAVSCYTASAGSSDENS